MHPASQELVKNTCFHIYHASCFKRWWQWSQNNWVQEVKRLEEQAGSSVAAARLKVRLDCWHSHLACAAYPDQHAISGALASALVPRSLDM